MNLISLTKSAGKLFHTSLPRYLRENFPQFVLLQLICIDEIEYYKNKCYRLL